MFVDSLINMPVEEVELKQKEIVGTFPNTYTFTKNIGEKLLKKHRGDLPLVIIRPSIIGAAYREPHIGWVDSISAATAVYLMGGLGLVKELLGSVEIIGDQIPVDVCSALIIAATADSMDKNDLMIYHSASSSRNPITWIHTYKYFLPYIGRNLFDKIVSVPSMDIYQHKNAHRAAFFFKRVIPAKGYYYLSKMVGTPTMKKNSKKLLKALELSEMLQTNFTHFMTSEWIFETYNTVQLRARLSNEDINTFQFDPIDVDWKDYFPKF
jgi:hypothetical protein